MKDQMTKTKQNKTEKYDYSLYDIARFAATLFLRSLKYLVLGLGEKV